MSNIKVHPEDHAPHIGSVTSGQSPTSERWEFLPDNEVTLEDSLCVVARVTNLGGPEERAARGLLIAAAPDMLAALQAAEKALSEIAFARPGGPTRSKIIEHMERLAIDGRDDVRAAIAKATGDLHFDSGG